MVSPHVPMVSHGFPITRLGTTVTTVAAMTISQSDAQVPRGVLRRGLDPFRVAPGDQGGPGRLAE